ncbi:amino acid adenylation domain-containing protein [Streptomyces sp. NPDC058657]|uniref:amino acid adenylation domain-containing protein n=1 Tax=unclassified Streptomyces TaxID=2593676 RepID=UPI003664F251
MPGQERETRFPLSAAQSGVWFAQQFDTSGSMYNIAEYVEITGPLDLGLLTDAVRRTLAESEAVRVRTGEDDDGPRQTLTEGWADGRDAPALLDLARESDPMAAARAWMDADLAVPVDLHGSKHLFTQAVLTLGPQRHLLYQRFHHLLLDGFGGWLLTRRTAEIYTALRQGTDVPACRFGTLAALLAEDADYRASAAHAEDGEFWRQQMSGLGEIAGLSRHRAPMAPGVRRDGVLLPEERYARLCRTAQSFRTSWSVLLIAALAAYTHRVTGSEDIVLGMSVAGRGTPLAKNTPGMTANVVPLRLSVRPDTTVAQLIEQVNIRARRALRHMRYRCEELRRDLGLIQEQSRLFGPQINVMPFDYAPAFGEAHGISHNTAVGPVDDFMVAVSVRGGGLRVECHANPKTYSTAELAVHRTGYLAALAAVIDADTDPERCVGRIDTLGADGRRTVDAWARAGGDAQPLPYADLAAAVAERARSAPHRPAVTSGDLTIGYGELDARADRLARILVRRGAGRGTYVAVALPRSAELIVALLAVLKSGAAYVPVDPDLPAGRIAYILADARPALVVTTASAASGLPAEGPPLVLVDEVLADDVRAHEAPDEELGAAGAPGAGGVRGADESLGALPADPAPHHPAYVIYTSGSTGRPKGVVVTHGNVTHLMGGAQRLFRFDGDDVWTLYHSYAFDFSVWELWGPLLHGGRLVVVPYEVSRSPQDFLALLVRERVTVLNQTPSAFRQLMRAERDDPATGRALALRYVVFGGEALDLAGLGEWYDAHADDAPVLVNMYGITETTVHVTHAALDRRLAASGAGSVIGSGLPGLEVHVLDSGLRPVPPGVVGEMYVAGGQLALGYLNRPALTAERFVAHPFDARGGRLYRSGDLAQWTPDGRLRYLGRSDDQVKLRGFRIEPGEIETVLCEHAAVADARAVVRRDAVGDAVLAAYVVPAAGAADPVPALRRWLRDRLPSYMVPTALVLLDAIPLTGNGKLDVAALPAPVPDARRAGPGTPPRDARESALVEVWRELLSVPDAGIDDDFFDSGGDSFKAVELARRAGDGRLSVVDVFQHPTPRLLAARLRTEPDAAAASWLHRLGADDGRPVRRIVIGIPYGGGSATAYQALATQLDPGTALWAAALPGHDPVRPEEPLVGWARARDQLVGEIARLRTAHPGVPVTVYGHCVGTGLALAVARRLEDLAEPADSVCLGAALPRAQEGGADDAALHAYLSGLGGFEGALDAADLRRVLAVVRHDMAQGGALLREATGWDRLRTPVRVIIGGADEATAGYRSGYRDWERFAHEVTLDVVPDGGHYFVKTRAEHLARLLG